MRMDDSDFEVSDLTRSPTHQLARPPTILRQRLTMRSRMARVATIACLLIVALAPFFAVTPAASNTFAAWVGLPTPPRPTPAPPGVGVFLLANTAPWGELEIDAHAAARLGIALQWPYGGNQIPTFSLAPGTHELVYRAEPFAPLRCHVSVPASPTDTCPLLHLDSNSPLFPPAKSRILDARALPALLPAAAFTALANAVEQRLEAWSGAAQMASGDHYLAADGHVEVATYSAQATVRYQINQNAHEQAPTFSGGCVSLCSFSVARTQLDADDWRLLANVVASWRYTQPSGQVIDAPAASVDSDAHALVPVSVRWNGEWSVDEPPAEALGDAPPCQVAHNVLGRLFSNGESPVPLANGSWGTYAAPPAAAGCLIVIGHAMGPTGQPIGETIQTLYSFGVLLAINQGAMQAFAQLSSAAPAEQALARQLAPPGAL
jgi:hypothetical protein